MLLKYFSNALNSFLPLKLTLVSVGATFSPSLSTSKNCLYPIWPHQGILKYKILVVVKNIATQ